MSSSSDQELLAWWGPKAAERAHRETEALMQKGADEALLETARLQTARLSPTVPNRYAPRGGIYIFGYGDWVKMGYTSEGPFERKARGFWHDSHPRALCGRLDDCRLLHYWSGSLPLEEALHKVLVSDCPNSEFYRAERLPEILDFLGNVLEPLVLPEDPGLEQWPPRKLNCCDPDRRFQEFRREEHGCRSYATKGRTAPCGLCGAVVSIRTDKLKQHQRTAKCQRGRK